MKLNLQYKFIKEKKAQSYFGEKSRELWELLVCTYFKACCCFKFDILEMRNSRHFSTCLIVIK